VATGADVPGRVEPDVRLGPSPASRPRYPAPEPVRRAAAAPGRTHYPRLPFRFAIDPIVLWAAPTPASTVAIASPAAPRSIRVGAHLVGEWRHPCSRRGPARARVTARETQPLPRRVSRAAFSFPPMFDPAEQRRELGGLLELVPPELTQSCPIGRAGGTPGCLYRNGMRAWMT
jgi:hypothetical protein